MNGTPGFLFWRTVVRAFAAPIRNICQPATIVAQPSSAVGANVPYASVDKDAKWMSDMLIRLGEVIEKPGFMGFRKDSPEDVGFDGILNSTHSIWSREDARELRGNFIGLTGRIIAANRAGDGMEQIEAAGAVNAVVNDLADILVGH